MTRFQRIALTAFVCLEAVIFFGAIVRATGSGLGCPDWPRCYGRLIPPTSADQIDFTQLDLGKFQRKAAQIGEDPATITLETLRQRFNAVETWIEFLNRTSSLPLSLSVAALLLVGFKQSERPIKMASVLVFALLVAQIIVGALVVKNLLKPNNVTLHMALAMLMLCAIVFAAWRSADTPWSIVLPPKTFVWVPLLLLVIVVVEGVLGSQVREMTDELARTHAGQPRIAWVQQLEQTNVYLIHRSASWLILGLGIFFVRNSRTSDRSAIKLQRTILGLIVGQMLLGVVLSQIGILAIAQILHIGLSSLLVSGLFLWLLAARRAPCNA